MTKRAARTDQHRPSVIVPRDYSYVLSFNLATVQDGWPVPSFGINCELDRRVELKDAETGKVTIKNGEHDADGRCCQVGLLHVAKVKFSPTGAPGKCGICGAGFINGDIWTHDPTGEHIHVGHDCADKYQLLADRSDWELMDRKQRRNATMMASRHSNERKLVEFCEAHPGLTDAFAVVAQGEPTADQSRALDVIADVKRKLRQYHSISDKQIALVVRLADQVRSPRVFQEEAKVNAPTGKQKFVGTVVSVKRGDDRGYGAPLRATVKVTTPNGVWLANGTLPQAILDATCNHGGAKGCEVEISATLQPSTDKKEFVFMKRPRGKVLRRACEGAASCGGCDRESWEWCPIQRTPEEVRRDQESHDYALRMQASMRDRGQLPQAVGQ